MCGITGFFGNSEISLERYYLAHKTLDHRGPDDEGFLTLSDSGAGLSFDLENLAGDKTIPERKNLKNIRDFKSALACLGHHRLKIVDLSPGGHQPMATSDNRFHIIYNGEVYNYIELRDELRSLNHVFETTSDTEVILKAFSQWGVECFNKFNGMWALVIYDSLQRKFYLSKDRFGIKPLYLYRDHDTLYFASELRFFKAMGLRMTLNKNSTADFLRYSFLNQNENTFYNEIEALAPAHCYTFDVNGKFLEKHCFWKLNTSVDESLAFDDAKTKLQELFRSSLELRMRSDVPVGTLLSGGLDSTSIVCNLVRNFKLPGDKLESFSAVFDETEFSEKIYIDKTVSKNSKIKAHFIKPTVEGVKQEFLDLIQALEIPVRSLATYSQYKLYQYINAQTDIVVLLNGQGADEEFAGYSAHYSMYFSELATSGNLTSLLREVQALNTVRPGIKTSIAFEIVRNLAPNFVRNRKLRKTLFPDATPVSRAFNFERTLSGSLKFDLHVSALPEYLHYEDRNSMHFSKEGRLPFLDYRIVEFAFSLPSKFKIKNGKNKFILREAVKEFATPEVLSRTDKMGFTSPQKKWERENLKSWMAETILTADASGVYDQKKIVELYENNEKSFQQKNQDILWRVFCFKTWYKLNFS